MKEEIGPTGKFPDGKLNDEDKGEINIGVTSDDRNIIIAFNAPVTFLLYAFVFKT